MLCKVSELSKDVHMTALPLNNTNLEKIEKLNLGYLNSCEDSH